MKLGISGQLMGKVKSLEEILIVLNQFNVKNMEIWPINISSGTNSSQINSDTFEGRDIAKAKDLFREYGITPACVTMSGAFNKEIAMDVKRYASALRYTVEVAKELGAPYVNHYIYHLCMAETPNLGMIMKYMEPAVELAEREGITLCLENEVHDATRTPQGMLKIIEAIASKSFKTNYDATNYYHAAQEGFPGAYNVLKDHIAYVHIKNGCIYNSALHPEKNRGALMTGALAPNKIYYPTISEGAVNIDGLLLQLKRDGYEGYCTLEPHTTPEDAQSYYLEEIKYLRERGFFL